jgi:hypothetical protein
MQRTAAQGLDRGPAGDVLDWTRPEVSPSSAALREEAGAPGATPEPAVARPGAGTMLADRYQLIAALASSPWSVDWAAHDDEDGRAAIVRLLAPSLTASRAARQTVHRCLEDFADVADSDVTLSIRDWGRERFTATSDVLFVVSDPSGAASLRGRIDGGHGCNGTVQGLLRAIAAAATEAFDGDEWMTPESRSVLVSATGAVLIDRSAFALHLAAVELGLYPDLDPARGLGVLGAEVLTGSFAEALTPCDAHTLIDTTLARLTDARFASTPTLDSDLVCSLLNGDLSALLREPNIGAPDRRVEPSAVVGTDSVRADAIRIETTDDLSPLGGPVALAPGAIAPHRSLGAAMGAASSLQTTRRRLARQRMLRR